MSPVPRDIGAVRFDFGKSAWLWSMLLLGVGCGVPALNWKWTAMSLGLTVLTLCLGHSVGLHRGVIHRAYETSPLLRGLLTELFTLTGLGGPLSWARLHAVRDFWQNQPVAPPYFAYRHSMLKDAWWNLHLRFEPADARAEARLPAGVLTDRWLGFLEATWPLHTLALTAVIFAIGGGDAVAVCVALRIAAGILGHWAIGYVAHRWGERRYVIDGAAEGGTNVWLLGVLSFGEGFHNNHHAHPASARMGERWFELDLGWYAVWALERLGLVRLPACQPDGPGAVDGERQRPRKASGPTGQPDASTEHNSSSVERSRVRAATTSPQGAWRSCTPSLSRSRLPRPRRERG